MAYGLGSLSQESFEAVPDTPELFRPSELFHEKANPSSNDSVNERLYRLCAVADL